MPSISPQKLERVFDILAERETARLQASQSSISHRLDRVSEKLAKRDASSIPSSQAPRPSDEQSFYSVRNSIQHRQDNRYSNILAYDRTAVSVEGKYLNANVVSDGKGGTWIAAQAPPPRAFDTFFRALYTGAATGRKSKNVMVIQLTGWEERGMIKADPYM
ncbi:uncharacterized protein IL334_007821 [Kwoniella shivajii]|uniref:Tyrosine-protein phosphatase domain-containing protein n=1 Tax=Kwoniella shivajii TaxID=564305 RepID=A0ABZ1D9R0_9TREE|nr:hypothetical protein IL334_007821 [Kwoniella shivajii]